MKLTTILFVVFFALLYVLHVPLHAFLFPEEAAMYAERVKVAEAYVNIKNIQK